MGGAFDAIVRFHLRHDPVPSYKGTKHEFTLLIAIYYAVEMQ